MQDRKKFVHVFSSNSHGEEHARVFLMRTKILKQTSQEQNSNIRASAEIYWFKKKNVCAPPLEVINKIILFPTTFVTSFRCSNFHKHRSSEDYQVRSLKSSVWSMHTSESRINSTVKK